MKLFTNGQIHRFSNHVALYLGTGETVYLALEQAESLQKILKDAAKDLKTRDSVDSRFKSTKLR